jgi:hypothetical protein
MMIPFLTTRAIVQSVATTTKPALVVGATSHAATLSLLRGGAAAAFDMGMAKTRLEGLAYGTVTALV